MSTHARKSVERHAAGRPTLVAEYWSFLRDTRKWWVVPILFVTLVIGLLVFLAGTGAAPFIYTLF